MSSVLLRSRLGRWTVGGLLALGGLWLALACLANAQSRALTNVEPSTALAWDPGNPRALSRLAELYAENGGGASDARMARELALSALAQAPLDGAALRVLGIEAQRAGDMAGAARLMAASDRVTRRDSTTQLWLLDQAIRRGAYPLAYDKAEIVLAGAPATADQVFPVLRMSLNDPRAAALLTERLARRPPWRERFVADVFAHQDDVDAARRLYAALSAGPAKPTAGETAALVKRLADEHAFREANDLWRRSLSVAFRGGSAGVYDGDFRGGPGAPPFNWRLSNGSDAFAELGRAPDGQPALHVQFSTGADSRLAEQLMVLPPGTYRLRGAALLGDRQAPDQLAWSVACAEGGRVVLARAAQGAAPGPDWTSFDVPFEVPAEGCGAQWLSLRGLAQDRFGTLEAWCRSLAVVPAAMTARAAAAPDARS